MPKISIQEQVDFANNLAVMLKSGIAINDALNSLTDQVKSKRFRELLQRIKKQVERGTNLSEAFGNERGALSGVFLSLLRAGEASGTLEDSLSFLTDWLERSNDLKKEISAALLYPKIVLVATFLLAAGLAIFILPKLIPLFESLRVELPLATRLLLGISKFTQDYLFIMLAVIFSAVMLFVSLNRLKPVKRFLYLVYINMPFVGGLIVDYQLALISKLLATLFRSGVSIVESLEVTSRAELNLQYQDSIVKIKDRILKGIPLSIAMKDYPKLYPKNLISIVEVGEKTGTIDNSFDHLTEFYSKSVSNKTKKLPTIIEPLLLIFIGLMVGFVAMSIILPIYEITRSFSQ